jgi:hypothetical protein
MQIKNNSIEFKPQTGMVKTSDEQYIIKEVFVLCVEIISNILKVVDWRH